MPTPPRIIANHQIANIWHKGDNQSDQNREGVRVVFVFGVCGAVEAICDKDGGCDEANPPIDARRDAFFCLFTCEPLNNHTGGED